MQCVFLIVVKAMNILNKLGIDRSVIAPLLAAGVNIGLLFVVYVLLRVEFLSVNWSYFHEAATEGRIGSLLWAGLTFDAPGIFYLNLPYILLMLFPLHLKERERYFKFCKTFFIIINAIGIFVNLADSVYFSYTLRRTTFDVFTEFAGDNNLLKIFAVESVRHWYLIIVGGVLVWGLWELYASPSKEMNTRPLLRYYIFSFAALAIGALISVSAIRGGLLVRWWYYIIGGIVMYAAWEIFHRTRYKYIAFAAGCAGLLLILIAPVGGWRHRDIRPIAISNASAYIKRPVEAALILNTPFTMIRTIGTSPFADPRYMPDAEMEMLYSPVHTGDGGNFKYSALKGKNIIVIILESFGREYVGSLNEDILGFGYKGFTPFLDSLVNVSATWRYTFDNGQKSIDALPSVTAGIPSFVKPFVLTPASVNTQKGLPGMLGQEGYTTAFFHGARKGSMGLDGIAKSVGFSKYFGRESFDSAVTDQDAEDSFDGYWGIWDEPFLQFMAKEITELPQPFMACVFTLSSHHPFNVPEKYKGKFPKGTLPIHQTIGYTDMALAKFFEAAKKTDWYDNTIFVVTNDHTNARDHDEYRSAISAFYGPILIFDPSGTLPRGIVGEIAQQTDIMPTVLNLVGCRKPYVAFGKDLFATDEAEGWAVNYNGVYQYVKYGLVLQFDGKNNVALYKLGDHKMEKNLLGKFPDREQQMQKELKAVIQQYMQRMLKDRLTAD